jgi:hypothetical protein
MSKRSPEPPCSPSCAESSRLRVELDELAQRGSDLARILDNVLASEQHDADGFARLITCRSTIADHRLALLVLWMTQLDGRLSRLENQLDRLSIEVGGHEEALKLLCEVLKELDDPYGYGLSLDERIAGEARDGFLDDRED